MIEKIRHGKEIESAKLNEIIEVVNNTSNEHQTIRDLGESIKNTISEVYNTLEKYSEQVGEHLDSIPEIKNLYADILLARDSVDWIDIAEDETDATAFIAAALTGYEGNSEEPAQRLKIIRGTTSQITLNTPEVKDKQILIAYDENSNRGIMYFDIGNRRIPVSASGDVNITALIPEFEFETLANGEEVIKIIQADGTTKYSKNLRGPAGTAGIQGPQGIKGEKGDRGLQGLQGIQGSKGQDGATTLLSIWFSNYSSGLNATENYNGHKYMGVKTYLSTDDEATVLAKPIKWFRISGDTLYPVYDSDTGYLTFTTTKPAESSFYIKGDQGPQGPKGEAPEINFRKADGSLVTLAAESAEGKYIYDASMFKGDQGDVGSVGPQGPKGDKGDTPSIRFIAENTEEDQPTITNTTPLGSSFDAVYTIKIPKGKDGISLSDTEPTITKDGEVILYRTDGLPISLGKIKGEKGEKGDPATISIKSAVDSKSKLPLTNLMNGDAYVVTSIVEGISISDLYICVDATATTVDTIYKNLGNIKGEKGDPGINGDDGSTWITGTIVNQSGTFNLESGYKVGDIYLNTLTSTYYRIISASGTTYILTEVGSLRGPQGPKGDKGDTGNDGRSILNVSNVPTSTLDNVDTYTITYTDDTTSTFNITNGRDGEDGKDGADGTTLFNGTDIPNEALGNIGDYYININNGNLYTKTTNTTWTFKICLKGTDGTNGKDGVRGPLINTIQGSTAPTSTSGFIPGDLALLLGTSDLYQVIGSEETKSWSKIGNIKGIQGPQGPEGPAGYYIKGSKIIESNQAVSITLQQSVYYELTHNNLTAISISLGTIEEGTVGEFTLEFTINAGNAVPTITIPDTVKYMNNWDTDCYEAGYKYILYIINNYCYVSRTEV